MVQTEMKNDTDLSGAGGLDENMVFFFVFVRKNSKRRGGVQNRFSLRLIATTITLGRRSRSSK
jgi:hypothetical protein